MKTKVVISSVSLSCITFILGYQLGTSTALDALLVDTNIPNINTQNNQPISANKQKDIQSKIEIAENNNNPSLAINDASESETQEETKASHKNLGPDASVFEILDFLLKISTSDKQEDMELFSPTLSRLKQAVKDDPQNMQVLLDYFLQAETDSRAPYYITSILQGADIPDKDFIINNLVQSLSSQGTENANNKLLHLVASTGAHHDNPDIALSLKNIAIYGTEINENKLYALDLLMPFQLKDEEKTKVVNDFTAALDTATSEEKSYWVENIIRFSPKQERTALASNFLSNNNDFATRVAILSTLHNGSIRPNDELKQQLFDIAQNANDPLTRHAKDALLYVFEINNDEYQILKSDGG